MKYSRLLAITASLWFSVAGWAASVDEVATSAGIYAGQTSDHARAVTVFKGIAYAAPPVGQLRWRPPADPIPFAGVRQANRTGAACWQARNSDASLYARGNLHRSEDCLFLNVFTGADDSEEALPVMVWFHGGGNTAGHGGPLIFDGSNLAARGAVIVTANYRLGPFGFLAHPVLTRESEQGSSGNYGLLDQLRVLQWVQENIAGFGGDPGRVTIFGQSAGGTDVCLLMASPLSEGLVHGVIGQSPGCITLDTPLQGSSGSGHARGLAFMEAMGINGRSGNARRRMRDLSARDIVANMAEAGSGGGPIIDGWVIPAPPYELLSEGRHNAIPVMAGGLSHEYFGLQHLSPEISEADLDRYLASVFGDAAAEVKRNYNDVLAGSPLDARKTIAGDNGFLLASRMWARLVRERGNNAYVYYFTRQPPVFRLYTPNMADLNGGQRTLGAYHSGELAYVFDNLDLVGMNWSEEDHVLAELVADYWVSFARDGDPNEAGLPRWPVYDPARDLVQILDQPLESAEHPRKANLDHLERLYLQQRQGDAAVR